MKNKVDSDQLASSEASLSGSTLFSKGIIEFLEKVIFTLLLIVQIIPLYSSSGMKNSVDPDQLASAEAS